MGGGRAKLGVAMAAERGILRSATALGSRIAPTRAGPPTG